MESSRILDAIHEKSQWIRREGEILKELDKVKKKKKVLIKKTKELRFFIDSCNENIRADRKKEMDLGIKGSENSVR